MVSHHPAKFGGRNRCDSGDIMFSVAEEEDPRCSCFNRHCCLYLKDMVWKHTAYHINNSDPGHTDLKQQLEKNMKITFTSPSKKTTEKEKEKNIGVMRDAKTKKI